MKKYRVVKAYLAAISTCDVNFKKHTCLRKVGEVIETLSDSDYTAKSIGALEEIKAWEPKRGERVWYVVDGYRMSDVFDGFHNDMRESYILNNGLIYPTREQAEECRKRMLEAARKYKEEVLG